MGGKISIGDYCFDGLSCDWGCLLVVVRFSFSFNIFQVPLLRLEILVVLSAKDLDGGFPSLASVGSIRGVLTIFLMLDEEKNSLNNIL